MSVAVAQIVHEVQAAGGHFSVAGDKIAVSAPRPLPGRLVNDLREHKLEVLAFLKHGAEARDADDWREWIAERAAIMEHDGGLSRAEADRRAYEHALIEWLNRHPCHGGPGWCAGCGDPIHDQGNDWRPLGDGATVHYGGPWGLRCVERHGLRRRKKAVAALGALGFCAEAC